MISLRLADISLKQAKEAFGKPMKGNMVSLVAGQPNGIGDYFGTEAVWLESGYAVISDELVMQVSAPE